MNIYINGVKDNGEISEWTAPVPKSVFRKDSKGKDNRGWEIDIKDIPKDIEKIRMVFGK
jgi:hypothetical protein